MKRINVAIIDKNQIIRVGLISFLHSNEKFRVSHTAENSKHLLAQVNDSENIPDVVIINAQIAKVNKHSQSRLLLRELPKCTIIYLGEDESEKMIGKSMSSYAHGFISKEFDNEMVNKSIYDIYNRRKAP